MMDKDRLRDHKINNMAHGVLLLAGMALLLGALGWLIAGRDGVFWIFISGIVILAFTPRLPAGTVMKMYRARPISFGEAPDLYRNLETLAKRAKMEAVPVLYHVPSGIRNAFAVGDERSSAIGLTDGILRGLTLRELTGVLAHELSHIRSKDVWVMNLANVVGRVTSVFAFLGQILLIINLPLALFLGARLAWGPILLLVLAPSVSSFLMLALSRTREFDADMEAVRISGDPLGLAGALRKLEGQNRSLINRILFPGGYRSQPAAWRTHPDTEERIERLLSLVERPSANRPERHWGRASNGNIPSRAPSGFRNGPPVSREAGFLIYVQLK